MKKQVSISTPDGDCRAFVFTPDQGHGPWPAAIMYADALGVRQTLFDMAERLASHGYYVLLPDLFWRLGAYEPLDPKDVFAKEELRQVVFSKFIPAGTTHAMQDTRSFLAFLDAQPEALAQKVGVFGYCMGGRLALMAAGNFPDRVAASASFHPGGLVTDGPESPHLLAPKIKGKVLVAGADQDANFTAEHKDILAKALKDAGVDSDVKIYEGALHGYAPPDMPVYNAEAAERHWREMLALFDNALKQPVPA